MISLGHNCPGLRRCLPVASCEAFQWGANASQKSSTAQNNSSRLIARSLRWRIEVLCLTPILAHRSGFCLSKTDVSYDDITWLTQAGPFSEMEMLEWEKLIGQGEDARVAKQLQAIAVQSRKREIALALKEQREPRFQYPLI